MTNEIDFDKIFGKLEKQKEARTSNTEGKIVNIDMGTVRDFVPADKLEKFDNPDSEVLQVHIKTPDDYVIKTMLTLSSHPNSNLQRYFSKYGVYPKVGGKYPLEFKSGFWRQATI